jgi:hypothetical protein
MRWVSVGTCQPDRESIAAGAAAAAHPRGRTVVRGSPSQAGGVAYSYTDTSAPKPGGNRRCARAAYLVT